MRQKITIDQGNVNIIPIKDIIKSRDRIKKEMTQIVKDYEKKSFESWMHSKIKTM